MNPAILPNPYYQSLPKINIVYTQLGRLARGLCVDNHLIRTFPISPVLLRNLITFVTFVQA
jgi:hypothetical protein